MPDANARLAELVVSKLAKLEHRRCPSDGFKCRLRRSEMIRYQLLRDMLREAGIEAAERKDG